MAVTDTVLIPSSAGSLRINPSCFFLFLRLQNKDISLVLTAISAKHASQPETGILWQKHKLYKSFGKTTKTPNPNIETEKLNKTKGIF